MTPSRALSSLHVPLAEHGIIAVGMDFGKTDGTLIQDSGQTVVYSCGLFWWPTGRMRHGRPVYAVHAATDPRGAARRIARVRWAPGGGPGTGETGYSHVTPMPMPFGTGRDGMGRPGTAQTS